MLERRRRWWTGSSCTNYFLKSKSDNRIRPSYSPKDQRIIVSEMTAYGLVTDPAQSYCCGEKSTKKVNALCLFLIDRSDEHWLSRGRKH